jgi:hypothetical protein
MKICNLILLAMAALGMTACNDDDFTIPAFLHVEAVKVVPPESNPITLEEGFYTSDITALYVIAHYPGAMKMDTIGLFEMPFTIPVLHEGPVDYLEFYPAVKQSGVGGALPYYSFYKPIRVSDTSLVAGDTLRFDTLSTTYAIGLSDMLMFTCFEPTEGSLPFDSVEWHRYAPEEACSGMGYASVHVPDSVLSVPFGIKQSFYVTDPTRVIYLELDTRSDMRFEVYMHAAYETGGSEHQERVMVINPSNHWQHMYINLGRTWAWFNHQPEFRLSFAALNVDGTEGDIRIDNVKLLTTL